MDKLAMAGGSPPNDESKFERAGVLPPNDESKPERAAPFVKLANDADNATLAFFTNPAYLSIIQRKMVKTPAEDNNNEAIKFYKNLIKKTEKNITEWEK